MSKVRTSWPVATSHNFTVLSPLPESTRVPSDENTWVARSKVAADALVQETSEGIIELSQVWDLVPAEQLLDELLPALRNLRQRSTSARGKFDKSQGRLTHRTGPSEYTYTFPAAQFVRVTLDSLQIIAAAAHH
jgi:hypothetical protein